MDYKKTIRYHWIDNIKFLGLFLVVFGHLGTSSLHDAIYGFHMPLFYFLSGLLHRDKPVRNVCMRLLVPYLLFNLLYVVIEFPWLYRHFKNFNFLYNDILGIIIPYNHPVDYPTWFLLSLFEIKCIIKIFHNNVHLVLCLNILCLAMCALGEWNVNEPFFLKNTIVGLGYYCIGFLFHCSIDDRQILNNRHRAVCLLGGVISITLYCLLMKNSQLCDWNKAIEHPLQYFYSLLGCLGFVFLFMALINMKSLFVERICMGGIAIIGLHSLFIQYFRRLIIFLGCKWGAFSIVETTLISSLIMALCIITIPYLNKYFPLLIGLNKRKI